MGLPKPRQAWLSLLLVALAAAPVHLTQEHVPEAAQQETAEATFERMAEELKTALRKMLQESDTVPLPGLPPLVIDGDTVSISLSLADIYLQGLNDSKVDTGTFTPPDTGFIPIRRAHGSVLFKKFSLLAGSYSSSGHILNLPFNGEGPMYLHLYDFFIEFTVKWKLNGISGVCVTEKTTTYDLSLSRMETHFENLNQIESPDLGQVVDIVVPSFAQDIVKRLLQLVNETYYDRVDKLVVTLINIYLKCEKSVEDILKTDELVQLIHDIAMDLIP